ncbi:CAP domain-containing protein [Butyrivibrio sp. YAB3001]|uniref:CAP domain-containing protein n=1 Tax=Butyrivibrio sp. YAB3001 TaxID=1520812 RepID=UPI0008F6395A|nr:CAP domain-containing protein [Butyrivibrio sp. YAB3001]SFB71045.1 Cysteine-rich secretory protein family protein [Butyrivibrio sp. YAB3001]
MKKFKKVFAVTLAVVMAFTFVACGSSSNSVIDDQAAVRGLDEGVGEIYIDDEAIALAGSAASSQAALDACQAVFALMNQERVARGLAALAWSNALTNAAQVRASEITTTFSHTRPNGSDFWTVDSSCQYGENLAKKYQSADSVYTAWMNSPTHAANIMDGGYKTVGIAICQTEDGSWYWAQEFGY